MMVVSDKRDSFRRVSCIAVLKKIARRRPHAQLIRDGVTMVTPTIAQTHHDLSDSGYDGASEKRDSFRRVSCMATPKKIARKG